MVLEEICRKAKDAQYALATARSEKDDALLHLARLLTEKSDYIIEENQKDILSARQKGISEAMLDRLTLNKERLKKISDSVKQVVSLPDPVGNGSVTVRPNGLKIQKIHVPLGVVGIIYEARPNVTADAAALCIKSGNCVILRGGSEAINSNIAIGNIIKEALVAASLPADCVSVLSDTSRETANALMKSNGYIDVLIPRGGKGLINAVVAGSTVPVIETGAGNCHIYVDSCSDLTTATNIVYNAKTSRPSVCNAAEKLLVHKDIAKEFLPMVKKTLDRKNVELRGCEKTLEILPDISAATEEDWETEYNDYILAIKVVDDIKQAVCHINKYNTRHSEAIITSSMENAEYFKASVDAAAVYVNASTRFTDGEEFGLGAEIGISTQKLHARGPMGLEALTTVKYLIDGNGQVR